MREAGGGREQTRPATLPGTDADFTLLLDDGGRVLACSDTVPQILGWRSATTAPFNVWDDIAQDDQQAAFRVLLEQARSVGSSRVTLQLPTGYGPLWVDAAAKRVSAADEPVQILVTARDIDHEWSAASHLAASEMQWRVAFEQSPIGGALLDRAGNVLVVNDSLCRMTGFQLHEMTRMNGRDFVGQPPGGSWDEWWADLLLRGNAQVDCVVHRAGGDSVYARLTAAALTTQSAHQRVVLQVEDITSRREAELELANRALNDALTGAPNRFLTREWLGSALEEHPNGGVAVLYCDLDRFKIINDSLGHSAGDDLLVQVVERMRSALRPEDLLGRVGGDEFVVVLEDIHTEAQLAEIAARLAESLHVPFDLEGHQHAVTLSLGGTIGTARDAADDVLMRADMALLRAKRLGRARYEAYDPRVDRVATKEDLQLEHDLRLSLDSGELRAHYQPIVRLSDFSIAGYEALMRWQHPDHGLLLPGRFLDLAETSGLIRPLGWWMLEIACREAATDPAFADRWIAVNASAGQLGRKGVADFVLRTLEESGLAAERLHLEITETALLTATDALARELRHLHDAGVRIALDDFGTGYSSLSLLRQFPVHVLKIDRSFIDPLLRDKGAFAIVKAMTTMCADLGIATVAEGIEHADQRDALATLGCSFGQGFLFGRAEPLTSAEAAPTPAYALRHPGPPVLPAPRFDNPRHVSQHSQMEESTA